MVDLADDADSPQETVERTEQQEAVQKALATLSEEYREVLLLRYMEELDYAEIAEVLQLPSGTVKSRINRAKPTAWPSSTRLVVPAFSAM